MSAIASMLYPIHLLCVLFIMQFFSGAQFIANEPATGNNLEFVLNSSRLCYKELAM